MASETPSATARFPAWRITLVVFLPFAFGYFLSYLFRTVNAVIADVLRADLGLGAAALGVLTSIYFIAFAAFQLPLGVLLDRFGPRRVEAALLVVAALGATIFALGEDLTRLAVGRGLIGFGVSSCLMAALTANVLWWPKERLPFINGCFMASGGLGAVFATTPVAALLPLWGWRGLFFALSALTLLAAMLIFTIVPERADRKMATRPEAVVRMGALLRGTLKVFASPLFWRLAPLNVLVQAAFMAYLGLWMGLWLRDVSGLTRAATADVLQYAALAMTIGFIGNGVLSDWLARWRISARSVATVGLVLTLLVQALLLLPGWDWPGLWVLYALFATASVTIYAILSQAFPPELAGRVNTAVNVLSFSVAFSLQSGVGWVIERFPPSAEVVAGSLSRTGHRTALALILLLEVLALLWMLRPERGLNGRVPNGRVPNGRVPNGRVNASQAGQG